MKGKPAKCGPASDGTKYAASAVMTAADETNTPSEAPFVLPKHLRFVRSLALVSGAAVGIAAGAVVFGSGCGEVTVRPRTS
jgi:hypothetical protein